MLMKRIRISIRLLAAKSKEQSGRGRERLSLDGCRHGRPAWGARGPTPHHSHRGADARKRNEVEYYLDAGQLCRITDHYMQQQPERAVLAQDRRGDLAENNYCGRQHLSPRYLTTRWPRVSG